MKRLKVEIHSSEYLVDLFSVMMLGELRTLRQTAAPTLHCTLRQRAKVTRAQMGLALVHNPRQSSNGHGT